MAHHSNPFHRGYRNLHISRQLLITDDDQPPVWRPLHPSQAHIPDDQLAHSPCMFSDDFALISTNQKIPHDLEAQCRTLGVVQTLVYAINGDAAGHPVHIGDTGSQEAALEIVRQLSFETGHYSRSWEISTEHVTHEAMRYLWQLADAKAPPAMLFVAFRIPGAPAVGLKLIATPWTTANLLHVKGSTAEQLRQEHLSNGVPPSLVDLLHLAANADVRFLILDADAYPLDGLPRYQE
ncbi:ABC transporter substrate-binding protein [Pseudomonas aeruginosa]|uniref:DUF5983 family protein n=1 Tax=Pseudomonas aeruginosa TaxID=287 RepID=UPI000EB00DCD|nr:ABC transporter substrate-binding protein [Pseudomonas aeruginosa]